MTTPNETLRAVRVSLRLSQDEFAKRLRTAGDDQGEPNDASKRLVQRWESGEVRSPRPVYVRALEAVTRIPVEHLGFEVPLLPPRVSADGRGGHDMSSVERDVDPSRAPGPSGENFSGIWLSHYEFFSSSREGTFTGLHHVLFTQRGNRITARSLPGASSNPDSPLSIDLTVDRNVVTGTWTEQTAQDGYYQGARYHGAIQLLIDPTGRCMTGKWVGFGKEFEVNTGPWEFRLLDRSTNATTVSRFSTPPQI
ncbi:helix-turn-helix domain-containing protein [Streptomyces rubellomurinus]|uniref:DNA-binding protein n=1 Tax=Streptomyces rubellomurinus (strain ATCC 31215) TaxID=359131 RepID=A0A0F2T8S8_STRR3|nr:helix-turn-helix transcriptional regulator [Streptomyces rubellomurinus]KJS59634.1 DNA-binding protein [Streptomyces rubellomurinus]